MDMPNFLVIGAAKSGSTSLYNYLKQHPQIFMSPVKEPRFFAFENEDLDFCGPGDKKLNGSSITRLNDYRSLFKDVSNEKAIGEVSQCYIYISKAPERIKHYVPEMKIVAFLRDPVERAFSNFMQKQFQGNEPISDFVKAIEAEPSRIRENWSFTWHYVRRGYYYEQLSRYFSLFPKENIRVYLYDEFKASNLRVLTDLFGFLGVDETFVPDMSSRFNTSGRPRSKALHRLLHSQRLPRSLLKRCLSQSFRVKVRDRMVGMSTVREALMESTHQELIEYFREDILKLETLLDRDLSHWLHAPKH